MSPVETNEIPPSDDSSPSACPKSGKRNLTLLMLGLTAAAGTATLFTRHGPQSAAAAATAASVNQDLRPNMSGPTRGDQSTTDQIVEKFHFAPSEVQVPLADLRGDPFRMGPSSTQPVQLPDDAAECARREQERQAALGAVKSLHLESIERDDSHRNCTINGVLYQEGQEVDGFVVEEIATTTVVVRRGVYRFELRVR